MWRVKASSFEGLASLPAPHFCMHALHKLQAQGCTPCAQPGDLLSSCEWLPVSSLLHVGAHAHELALPT